jgi:hypothetical protein
MTSWKRILLVTLIVLTILSLLLSACAPVERLRGNGNNDRDKGRHKDNGKDKDKENGKDQDQDKGGKADKILICHKTGSPKKPYVQISVANDAAREGHATHAGDLIPAPEAGCPTK